MIIQGIEVTETTSGLFAFRLGVENYEGTPSELTGMIEEMLPRTFTYRGVEVAPASMEVGEGLGFRAGGRDYIVGTSEEDHDANRVACAAIIDRLLG